MTDTALWASRTELPPAPDGSPRFLVATHVSGLHADGAVVDVAEVPDGEPTTVMLASCSVISGHVRVDRLDPGPLGLQLFPGSPPLRYVVMGEPDASPPAVSIFAFHDPSRDGVVTGAEQAVADGLRLIDRVAGFRWLPGSGVVHQLYVSGPDDPAGDWRRRKLGTKISCAAEATRVAHGWPALHDSGQHTETGRAMVDSFAPRWPARFTAEEVIVPSMDVPRQES